MTTTEYGDVESCVDVIIDRLGTDITAGAPLGLGKPNHILNELVDRATENPDLDLTIWSALSLSTPDWDSELERRLVEPLNERIFRDYPNLTYDRLVENGGLPDNVEVHEFYFQPGEYLGNGEAQQHHHSVNYTHVPRAIEESEMNLLLQLVGVGEIDGERYYNLGSNADLTHELVEMLHQERAAGDRDAMIVGQVNRNMPFMHGDAPIQPDEFDIVLDDESYDFSLFGPPNMPVSTQEHAIGVRVSSLIEDGGTLQIGIGSLGDAIGSALELRQHDNETYREIAESLGIPDDAPDLLEEYGGLAPFEEGLYASSEMLVEAFLHLFEEDILTREAYNDVHIQRLVNEGVLGDGIDADTLDALVDVGAIGERLDQADVDYLKEWGIFHEDVTYNEGSIAVASETVQADLADEDAYAFLVEHALGDALDGGKVLHGAFFLGSNDFYESLRQLPEADRQQIGMKSVQFTNQLYGNETLNRLQRQDARFVNTGMKATVTGGVVSDGLENNQVISGVGGQFNFVNMAHELDGGRSIIMIRATRESGGEVESNIVWNYGHVTIPRHLRDIVVTEYGVADLRDKSDSEVIEEMIKIADSRFQDELVEKAKANDKLSEDWEVPVEYRNNYPEALEASLAGYEQHLPQFPFGTDVTEEERHLTQSLRNLESKMDEFPPEINDWENLKKALLVPDEADRYLERMGVASPRTPRELLYKRIVTFALAESEFV